MKDFTDMVAALKNEAVRLKLNSLESFKELAPLPISPDLGYYIAWRNFADEVMTIVYRSRFAKRNPDLEREQYLFDILLFTTRCDAIEVAGWFSIFHSGVTLEHSVLISSSLPEASTLLRYVLFVIRANGFEGASEFVIAMVAYFVSIGEGRSAEIALEVMTCGVEMKLPSPNLNLLEFLPEVMRSKVLMHLSDSGLFERIIHPQ